MNQRYCEHGRFEQRCGLCNAKEYSQKEIDLIIAGTEKQQADEIERKSRGVRTVKRFMS
jgi:hypothetical protein